MSLRAALTALIEPKIVPVTITVDGAPLELRFREMSGGEAEDVFDALRDATGAIPLSRMRELRQRVAAASLCDEAGAALFTVEELGRLPRRVYQAVTLKAMEVNAMIGKDDDGDGATTEGVPASPEG